MNKIRYVRKAKRFERKPKRISGLISIVYDIIEGSTFGYAQLINIQNVKNYFIIKVWQSSFSFDPLSIVNDSIVKVQ